MFTSALEVAHGLFESTSAAVDRVQQQGARLGRGKAREYQRLPDELARIRQGAADAAGIVESLFAESGTLGQAFGHPLPPPPRRLLSSASHGQPGNAPPSTTMLMWAVDDAGPAPARIGPLAITWPRFEPQPARRQDFSRGDPTTLHFSRPSTPDWHRATFTPPSHVVDVQVALRVDADPPLSQALAVTVQRPGQPTAITAFRFSRLRAHLSQPPTAQLPAGERSCETAGTLTLAADPSGRLLEPVEAHLGNFKIVRK
jgi:hypothetical protein